MQIGLGVCVRPLRDCGINTHFMDMISSKGRHFAFNIHEMYHVLKVSKFHMNFYNFKADKFYFLLPILTSNLSFVFSHV